MIHLIKMSILNVILLAAISNYFARRLHYAAGEVRSYTLYFPMHHRLP